MHFHYFLLKLSKVEFLYIYISWFIKHVCINRHVNNNLHCLNIVVMVRHWAEYSIEKRIFQMHILDWKLASGRSLLSMLIGRQEAMEQFVI